MDPTFDSSPPRGFSNKSCSRGKEATGVGKIKEARDRVGRMESRNIFEGQEALGSDEKRREGWRREGKREGDSSCDIAKLRGGGGSSRSLEEALTNDGGNFYYFRCRPIRAARTVTTPRTDRDVFYIHFAAASGSRLQHPLDKWLGVLLDQLFKLLPRRRRGARVEIKINSASSFHSRSSLISSRACLFTCVQDKRDKQFWYNARELLHRVIWL